MSSISYYNSYLLVPIYSVYVKVIVFTLYIEVIFLMEVISNFIFTK